MTDALKIQKTVHYKTWIKESLVEGLQNVFVNHPDSTLQKAKITIDFPTSEAQYPAVVVRFFERQIENVGVGHRELIESEVNPGTYNEFKHYLYHGDIEFAIYALSSLDRDLMADSLVQTLAMGEMASYTRAFLRRIIDPDPIEEPETEQSHFLTVNTDILQGQGETQTQVPWLAEDVLVYQTSYRMGAFGEFYSLVEEGDAHGLVEYVEVYPYMGDNGDPIPNPDPTDPGEWQ